MRKRTKENEQQRESAKQVNVHQELNKKYFFPIFLGFHPVHYVQSSTFSSSSCSSSSSVSISALLLRLPIHHSARMDALDTCAQYSNIQSNKESCSHHMLKSQVFLISSNGSNGTPRRKNRIRLLFRVGCTFCVGDKRVDHNHVETNYDLHAVSYVLLNELCCSSSYQVWMLIVGSTWLLIQHGVF